MGSMPHRFLAHTADSGIEATADSLSMLIRELAAGMFGLMARIEPAAAERWIDTRIESPSVEDLVVDTLSELLWLAEVEGIHLCEFRVTADESPYRAIVEAGGVPIGTVQAVGPPIKAVTYHELLIDQAEDGWRGRVYFDV